MSITIQSTEFHSDILMVQDESGGEQPAVPGAEAFSITLRGRAGSRSEVIAFVMMACELAEDGVISSEAELADSPKSEAAPANDNAAPPVERAKRSYTRRQPKASPLAVEPELPNIPVQATPAPDAPAPVATPAATAVFVSKTEAAPLRSREADVPAPSLDAPTAAELEAYEAANPFTEAVPSTPAAAMAKPLAPPKAAPVPAASSTATASFTLPPAAREAKDIRGLLFAIAKELGETADAAGAPVNEPSAAQMLAYAEAHREALAKECVLFKGGFNFDRVKNGIDAIYA